MPEVIGVVGAGTMGAGIAQLAAAAGARTLLRDPVADARERGLDQIADGLERWRAKGRLEREPGEVAAVAELAAWRRPGSSSRRRPSAWSSSASSSRPSARSPRAPCSPPTPPRSRSPRSPVRRPTPGAWSACTSSTPRPSCASSRSSPASTPRPRRSRSRARPGGRWARRSSTPPTGPGSWSTAATGPSASRRSSSCRSAWPASRPSTPSRAPPAFAWARSSCRTSWGSTSATRSRSPSTSSASASRAGAPRR